ncbi:MAG: cytochrome C [Deltaproteobacteria bacterium]|nr:MAG: cytochrome C [Deltaproteobacteria bacterium]
MHDSGKIIGGLVIFVAGLTFPFWFTLAAGQADYRPDPERPTGQKHCVEDTAYMKAWHMDLLDHWRDEVVRNGQRVYLPDKRWPCSRDEDCTGGFCQQGICRYDMSLTNNCLECHRSRARFCDRCHDYLEVKPYCWDCHLAPEEE